LREYGELIVAAARGHANAQGYNTPA
jgi:hypothetical protein